MIDKTSSKKKKIIQLKSNFVLVILIHECCLNFLNIWFGLWHINHCGLFNSEFRLYIYIYIYIVCK